MRELVYDDNERCLKWAADKIGVRRFKFDARALGLEDETGLRAVVVYDCFSTTDCCMHIASDGTKAWMTKALLQAAFIHPFCMWGLNRVTGLVPAKNKDALNFDLHLGFEVEGCAKEADQDGGDIMYLGLLRRNCRFIPEEYRK